MRRSRLATKLLLASLPIALVALLAGGYIAWTFLDEAGVQDETARASTVASQAMATIRTMWSEEHLANTLLIRPDQVDPANLESVQVELDSAVARLESAVNTFWRQASGGTLDVADRVVADAQGLRAWLNEIRSNETLTAADVETYPEAGNYLLDIIGQASLNLEDRIKGRELVAAEALAEAALVSFQQEQLVRLYISPQSNLSQAVVEEALNARETAFQNWTKRAADASPAAAQELSDLAAMEEAVTGQAATGILDINGFPTDRNELLIVAAERLAQQVSQSADADADRARTQALILGGSVFVILMAAGYASIRIGRSLVRRVRIVTEAARQVAEVDLPNLVDALRNPQATLDTSVPTPIGEGGPDEVGELATSFSALHRTLIDVARQQMEILRRGVSEIFVTLARRNRALVDRQLALIDQLENREEDPEILGGYYKLDHLATRMRRNAESLLVLAGTDTPRLWAKPLEVSDAVRAALGEVDEYQRIDVLALEPVRIAGSAVADMAHLLSELLDNATQFSPPTDRVRVAGLFEQEGYLITVSDRGIGMTDARLAELNRLLVQPPVLGLALDPTLGMYVVSRLAARHGITVRLVSGVPGVTVKILIPRTLLETATPARTDEGPRTYVASTPPAEEDRPPLVVKDNGITPPSPHRVQPRPGHEREPVSARTPQGLPMRPTSRPLVGAEAEAGTGLPAASARPIPERHATDRPAVQRFAVDRPAPERPGPERLAPDKPYSEKITERTPSPNQPTASTLTFPVTTPPKPTVPSTQPPSEPPAPTSATTPPTPQFPFKAAIGNPTSVVPKPSSTTPSSPPPPTSTPSGPSVTFVRPLSPSTSPSPSAPRTPGPSHLMTPPTTPLPPPTVPKAEPKRFDPGEGLPTRVPGTSFNESPIPKDTTSKSEIGPEGIKSALDSYQTGKETAERGAESSDQRQRDLQNQPTQGSDGSSQDGLDT